MNYPNINITRRFNDVDSKLTGFLVLEGREYEIENFQIVFGKPVDFKGQPQQEAKGGQFLVSLSHVPNDTIYKWGKTAGEKKSGEIKFKNDSEGTILEIKFIEAHCISLHYKVNAFSGTETSIVISPKIIEIDDIILDNMWRNK